MPVLSTGCRSPTAMIMSISCTPARRPGPSDATCWTTRPRSVGRLSISTQMSSMTSTSPEKPSQGWTA